MTNLRHNTGNSVRVGPFLLANVSGTAAPVGALAVTNFDQAQALKAKDGGIVSLAGQGDRFHSATAATGYYTLSLTAAICDQIGELILYFVDDDAFLPVREKHEVLPQAVYDAMYSDSASSYVRPSELDALSASLVAHITAEVDAASVGLATVLGTLSGNQSTQLATMSANLATNVAAAWTTAGFQAAINGLSSSLATLITAEVDNLSQGLTTQLATLSGNQSTQLAALSGNLATNVSDGLQALSSSLSTQMADMSASLHSTLDSISASVAGFVAIDSDDVANRVWDEARAGHTGGLAQMYDRQSDHWNYIVNTVPNEFDALSASIQTVDNTTDALVTSLDIVSANQQVIDNNVDTLLTKVDSLSAAVHVDGVQLDMTQQLPASATSSSIGHALLQANTPKSPTRDKAYANVPIYLVQDTDHVSPATGITVTVERSVDGADFTAVAGNIVEVGNGLYRYSAGAADLSGGLTIFKATATGVDPFLFGIPTEATKEV